LENSKLKSKNSKVTPSGSSMTMADLLSKSKSSVVAPRKGDILKGTITKLTSAEILIDIHAKTEAVVLENDKRILRNILNNFKVGEEVSVNVLNPESDRGNTVVSLRRTIDDLLWEKLEKERKEGVAIEASIKEITKGGFLVDTKIGLSGFLPNSQLQLGGESISSQGELLGRKLDVYILDLDRQNRKIIFSQKKVLDNKGFEDAVKSFKVGQKIDAFISNIVPFGLFVNIQLSDKNTVDGLIHSSELSWEKAENPEDLYNVGQKIEAVIIGFDKESKRINLSMKKLTKNPFEDIFNKYTIDQKVSAKVVKITSKSVLFEIDTNSELKIEGLIKKEKIPPTVSYKEGETVKATISEIDKDKQRFILLPVLLEKPIGYR